MSEREFWSQTPRQIVRCFDGQGDIIRREQNERTWLAWHVAALMRTQKFPKLDALLTDRPRKKAQTPEQMLAVIQAINAMHGGTVH